MITDDIQRFWSKVDKSSPTGCWEWTGLTHPFGYGRFGYEKKKELAHRVSYNLHNPPLLKGQCVLHQCDNPKCVNPAHLKAGSRKDNAQERDVRNRTTKGEHCNQAILTDQQVRIIKSSTKSITELRIEYGVAYGVIWSIKRGINWKHI